MEADFETKLREMMDRHDAELRELTTEEGPDSADGTAAASGPPHQQPVNSELSTGGQPKSNDDIEDELERQRRIEKARKKREKAREKERERERQVAEERANAGPSARDVENEIILNQLRPLNLRIHEVPADGHCLYRAVAAHYDGAGYGEMST